MRTTRWVSLGMFLLAASWAQADFSAWAYVRKVSFSTATVTNNYQVRIDLTNNFNYAKADSAGNDLRFQDTNTLQSLSYWIQAWTNAGTSTVWVAVPSAGTTGIKLYYGNSGAPAVSSGTNTFIFFDDFNAGSVDTARWTIGGSMTEAGGYASGNPTSQSGSDYLFGKTQIPINTLTHVRMRDHSAPNTKNAWPAVLIQAGNPASYIGFGWQDYSGGNRYANSFSNGTTQVKLATYTTDWYDLETTWQAGINLFLVNGSPVCTNTTQVPGSSSTLKAQVAGNADYDFIYVRQYVSSEPTTTVGGEQFAAAPTVDNSLGATGVTTSVAWLNGTLVATGTSQTVWGILWGTNDPGATIDTSLWLGGGSTNFGVATGQNLATNILVTGLLQSQRYYYALWATNASGTNVSARMPFATQGPPSVDNGTGVGYATQIGALLKGTVLAGSPNPQVWIYWGTTDGGTDTNAWNKGGLSFGALGVGSFATNIVGSLGVNSQYWYRCYATNTYGGAWAPASTNFTTTPSVLTLTSDMALSGGVVSGTNTAGQVENIRTNVLDTTLFWWADKNGDNTPNDPASSVLNMAGHTLARTDGTGIKLNLNDGTSNGSITNGGRISTTGSYTIGPPITITNAANLSVNMIDTLGQTYAGGGVISLFATGDIVVTSLVSSLAQWGGSSGGGITVQQQGNLNVGTITNTARNDTSIAVGPITLTGGGANAGVCSIGFINQSGSLPGDVTIQNYRTVAIGAAGIDARDIGSLSSGNSHYPGSVFIRNIGAGGVTVSGDILEGTTNYNNTSGVQPTGVAITNIAGNVWVRNIDTHNSPWGLTPGNNNGAGSILISNVAGSVTAGNLIAYCGSAGGSKNAGNITISAAGSVSVGSLDTRQAYSNASWKAGSVTLTAYGNLAVTGSVVTLFSAYGGAQQGILSLVTAPGSSGRITVNSQTTDVFDVSQMQAALFNSDSGSSYLAGVLTNFATGASGGNGTLASPFVTTQTVLRVNTNQTLYYSYTVGGLNGSLGGAVYKVANLAGSAGVGGLLVGMQIGAPAIANAGVSGITGTSASLIGNLTAGNASVSVTCYWGPADGGTVASAWANTNSLGTEALGYVTNSISGLTGGQAYYFRYYATNGLGGTWAPLSTPFSTLGAPTVNNGNGASGIGATSVTANGNLTVGTPNPGVWVYWGATDGGASKAAWSNSVYVGQESLGAFSAPLTGLTANAQYWYRCYASNVNGDAWALASTNFTTAAPVLTVTPASALVLEGALGTTNLVTFTATLSGASATGVSVNYATADGTALSNTDYVAASGLLSIPAGALTASFSVPIIGGNVVKPLVTFVVSFANATNASIGTPQVSCTISNNNNTFYVRGDGSGNDTTHGGSSWSDAFATLQHALTSVPYNQAITINVQASTGSQYYATCARQITANTPALSLNVAFQGGWQDVDNAPVQTGLSQVMSPTTNQAGIALGSGTHQQPIWLTVNSFAFANVTMGVACSNNATLDNCGILLSLSNCTINAQSQGAYVFYTKGYPTTSWGGICQVQAVNVNIVAGLGGAGDGIHAEGLWMGSSVSAAGLDPATGAPRVSTIRSLNGNGVFLSGLDGALNNEMCNATFSNLVVYGCASNGVHLDVAYYATRFLNAQGTFRNCTIADNGANGLDMLSQTPGSWASITNCIFAGNAGQSVSLSSTNGVFTCLQNYNVFSGGGLLVNGAGQSVAGNSATADPLLYAKGAKPYPWYVIGSKSSPAYHSGSEGKNRGAYQTEKLAIGTTLFIR